MTLVVEDGTGKDNAQAFCDVAYAEAYADARGLLFTGATKEKEVALVRGFDWLSNELRLKYVGTRKTSAQRGPWPRTGASENYGQAIADTVIPWRLMDANAELAIMVRAGFTLQDDIANGGLLVSSKTVDVLSTSWFAPEKFQLFSPIPGETVRVTTMGFLAPLLRSQSEMLVSPVLFQPVDATPFVPAEYDV